MEPLVHHADWEGFETYMFFMPDASAHGRLVVHGDGQCVLDTLSVSKDHRKRGLGTKMQEVREDLARTLGAKHIYLFVKKGSWMRKWYDRRGYKYHCKYEGDSSFVWLKKKL